MNEIQKRIVDAIDDPAGYDSIEKWREDTARAILQAVREPTAEMIEAGFGDNPDLAVIWTAAIHEEDARNIWRAMIDAALK